MAVFFAGATEVDLCQFCGGLWFDARELEAVAGRALELRLGAGSRRPCPRCSEGLDSARLEGIEVETCSACLGTFLDAGEVQAIAGRAVSLSSQPPAGAGGSGADPSPPRQRRLREAPLEFECTRCGGRRPWDQGFGLPNGGRDCDACYGLGPRLTSDQLRHVHLNHEGDLLEEFFATVLSFFRGRAL